MPWQPRGAPFTPEGHLSADCSRLGARLVPHRGKGGGRGGGRVMPPGWHLTVRRRLRQSVVRPDHCAGEAARASGAAREGF
eukprot:scaffold209104_cov30-Tisochrysis_lutea.AAC.1